MCIRDRLCPKWVQNESQNGSQNMRLIWPIVQIPHILMESSESKMGPKMGPKWVPKWFKLALSHGGTLTILDQNRSNSPYSHGAMVPKRGHFGPFLVKFPIFSWSHFDHFGPKSFKFPIFSWTLVSTWGSKRGHFWKISLINIFDFFHFWTQKVPKYEAKTSFWDFWK